MAQFSFCLPNLPTVDDVTVVMSSFTLVIYDTVDCLRQDWLNIVQQLPFSWSVVYLISRLVGLAYFCITVVLLFWEDNGASWKSSASSSLVKLHHIQLWLFAVVQILVTLALLQHLWTISKDKFKPAVLFSLVAIGSTGAMGSSMITPIVQGVFASCPLSTNTGACPWLTEDLLPCYPLMTRVSAALDVASTLIPLAVNAAMVISIMWAFGVKTPVPASQNTTVRSLKPSFGLSTLSLVDALLQGNLVYHALLIVAHIIRFTLVRTSDAYPVSQPGIASDPCFALMHVCGCRIIRHNNTRSQGAPRSEADAKVILKELSKLPSQERREIVSSLAFAMSRQSGGVVDDLSVE